MRAACAVVLAATIHDGVRGLQVSEELTALGKWQEMPGKCTLSIISAMVFGPPLMFRRKYSHFF
jgi:hypothetical protein